MKLILSVIFSMFVALFAGVGIEMATGFSWELVSGAMMVLSFIPMPFTGITLVGVYREVWTGKVIEELGNLEKATFLDGIEDYSNYVSNVGDEMQVIHLVYMGVLPEVLVNNTTYPIPLQALDQEDIPIALDKFQTKRTPITDDELYALSYDKIKVVKNKHSRAIAIEKAKKAIHALAPSGNTSKMPVLVSTGADDGTGRKRLTVADLIRFKQKLDDAGVPDGRRLVLCSDHENDLLLEDTTFKERMNNHTTGVISNQYGFEIYSYKAMPYYNASQSKIAYGAVPTATDRPASVCFALERAAKAAGWVKMYYKDAKTDPEYQRNEVNFRHNAIVLPVQEDGRGALVSANV